MSSKCLGITKTKRQREREKQKRSKSKGEMTDTLTGGRRTITLLEVSAASLACPSKGTVQKWKSESWNGDSSGLKEGAGNFDFWL
jgi:hypothetical protein